MQKTFEIKWRDTLGPEESDDKEMTILNRKVRVLDNGDPERHELDYEADPRHA